MNSESINAAYPNLVSVQGRLANELKISFGHSPAVAHAIAATAHKIYDSESELTKPCSELYSAVHLREPAGKPLDMCQRVNVKLTMWDLTDPEEISHRKKVVFRRITQDAYDQNGVLTIEDCERLLFTDKRTIKRYISEYKTEGIHLPLRGYVHSTGRGQTHKTEIICFYLEGLPLTEIQLRTYHSMEAITRYIHMFSRIAVCYAKQNMKARDITTVTGCSYELVKQYLKIFEKYANEDNERLGLILNPEEIDNSMMLLKKKIK